MKRIINTSKRNDYTGMLIIQNKNEAISIKDNYYAINDKVFIFNKYKTAKLKSKQNTTSYIHKNVEVPVSNELAAIIEEFINHKDLKKSNVLLSNTKFVFRRLIGILGGTQPIDTLRHSIITYQNKIVKNVEERITLAENMGHSVMMQLYYVKNGIANNINQ
jgi:integrase